jgi:hypothetical protein
MIISSFIDLTCGILIIGELELVPGDETELFPGHKIEAKLRGMFSILKQVS